MPTFTMSNGTECETGCVIAGHWGNYGLSRMLGIADGILGTTYHAQAAEQFSRTAEITTTMNEHGIFSYEEGPLPAEAWDGFTFEFLNEIADEAEAALNDVTPEGFVWHWHDGEFFASTICDEDSDEDCTDETCAHWFWS